MEPALMFNRRFGPGFASLLDELFDETEADGGGWMTQKLGRDAAGPASPSRSVRGSASSATRGNR